MSGGRNAPVEKRMVASPAGGALVADVVTQEYERDTPASRVMYTRLRRVLPGGETRSVTYYPPYPVAIDRGDGPFVIDVDGRRYIDVLNNYTALVHGHGYRPMVVAIQRAVSQGCVFPAPHRGLLEFGEELVARYPAADLVRFTNSGTEAAMLALRVVRRATGRRRIVVFRGAYHGSAPDFLEGSAETVHVCFNDMEGLNRVLDATVAAVFVEPFLGSAGVIPAADGFLAEVEQSARAVGALLVLDEVQSLRNAVDGVHGSCALRPDLLLLGKVIGGGLPVGALAGREEVMEVTAADNPSGIAHSGTFNGNVLTVVAGHVALRHLDAEAIAGLNSGAEALAVRIERAGAEVGLPVAVTRAGSIMHVHLLEHAPTNAGEASQAPAELTGTLHLALLGEGVYAAPRGMLNLSTALSADHLEAVGTAYERALARCAEAVATG